MTLKCHIKDGKNVAPPARRVRRITPPLMIPDPDCWVVPLKLFDEKKCRKFEKNQANNN